MREMREHCTSCKPENHRQEETGRAESGYRGIRWRLSRPDAFDGKCSRIRIASLAVLLLIGTLDYVTGYELGFFIFYFIPVALSSWYCGRSLGLQIAVGSALVWYLSDKYTFHPYAESYFIYWEMFMRLLSFLTTTMTISRIRSMVLNEERLLSDLLAMRQELASLRSSNVSTTSAGTDVLDSRSAELFRKNSSDGYQQVSAGIGLKTLVHGNRTSMTEFRLQKGAILPLHSHIHEQTGYLVAGRIQLTVGSDSHEVQPGDSWCIPGGVLHSAEIREESVAVEVFSPVREDYLPE